MSRNSKTKQSTETKKIGTRKLINGDKLLLLPHTLKNKLAWWGFYCIHEDSSPSLCISQTSGYFIYENSSPFNRHAACTQGTKGGHDSKEEASKWDRAVKRTLLVSLLYQARLRCVLQKRHACLQAELISLRLACSSWQLCDKK